MMKRPKGLGRGLDSLLGEDRPAAPPPSGAPSAVPIARLQLVEGHESRGGHDASLPHATAQPFAQSPGGFDAGSVTAQ